MNKRKGWILLLSLLLSFILGCNSFEGMQGVRERADQEGKRVLEKIDGYAQQAENATLKAERACFSHLVKIFPKSSQGDGGRGERG